MNEFFFKVLNKLFSLILDINQLKDEHGKGKQF